MAAELPLRLQRIAQVFDSSRPLLSSELVFLSDLSPDELKFFKDIWAGADISRRYQVISQLVHLSEVDFKLDFSRIFIACQHDADERVRIQAITGLEIEENYVPIAPLIQTLREDSSAKVRAAAATALGKFAMLAEQGKLPAHYKDEIYAALLEVLDNSTESSEVKRRALEAISPFSLPRVKELIEQAYHTEDVKLKASAIYAMGRNCNPVWLNALLSELNNNEAEIRYEAAHACGELGAEEAVPHLLKLTGDEDAQVQEAAIKALGEIGGEHAKQALNKLAKSRRGRVRQAAESALKELQFCQDPLSLDL
ncbi:MAG TPA: phycocyanin alpha phycocyanobilin lyase [Dehalococcoidia bacterium]|nr:phycocyanin alpha phycocyanobilin lyase [Dehalococcoidia bacterium]